ncbi:hypothetical protein EMIHUDRAFT_229196 [Emiliania huxleyi CCMP1516]|uniref:SGNH hydrolase-type esterase domain-containing protein n=2 Tax=Emiliania huxleyi TaxID=2903 RepID=A0A0D3KDP5_EMIH1|nr:hypothetical protein EMIHUDRAFT_229196 [Emiliania huxleyi CCMP1516]EOD33880.1 hypothetical protein EMIHUDRAFT_229196 [Emiliania huxleyi CCMP1516]|eukprot:XP_005786309.1 hypothetical protein EMIHUDRAFT_229196 [Emiliania huxleyi CCMP1516]
MYRVVSVHATPANGLLLLGILQQLQLVNDVGKPDWWQRSRSFSLQLTEFLQSQVPFRHVDSAIGGMGPILAASCMDKFVPSDARVATIEYIPNIGYTEEDGDEIRSIERITHRLWGLGAQIVFVNILPGTKRFAGCVGQTRRYGCHTRARVAALRDRVVDVALRYNASIVTVDDDSKRDKHLFNKDHMHISQKGHHHVFHRLLGMLNVSDLSGPPRKRISDGQTGTVAELGVTCMTGDDIAGVIQRRHRFERVTLDRRSPPKVGWETRLPRASLAMCLPLPRGTAGVVAKRYRLAVGMQVAGPSYVPAYGIMRVSCHGGCRCRCMPTSGRASCLNGTSYDTRGASNVAVTKFFKYVTWPMASNATPRKGACSAPSSCLVRVHSSDDETRNRIVLRSLIVGIDDWHTGWINEYHTSYARMDSR